MRRLLFAAFLLTVTPVLAQPAPPAAVNPVTGGAVPSPFQALGNVLRGQTPAPPPPPAQAGEPPLPTAIAPVTAPQDRPRGP